MNARVPLVIARTEGTRAIRLVVGDRTKLLITAAIAVFTIGPILLFGAMILPSVGEEIAAGNVEAFGVLTVGEAVTGGTALAWLFVVVLAAIRTVTNVADVDEPACLLVSAPLSAAVVGLIGAEVLLFALWLVVPTLVLAAAFAFGAGTVAPVVLTALLVGVVLLTAIPVGFVVGVCVRHLLTVYEPIARYRTPLAVLLAVGYFGAIATGEFGRATAVLFDVLGASPLGWPGNLLLFGIPNVTPSAGTTLGAVVGILIVTPVSVGLAVRAARVHFFSDPARTDRDDEPATEHDSSSRLGTVLSPVLGRPVQTVTVTAIRRTKRAPVRLLYVAYPLFGGIFFAEEIVRTGSLSTTVALLLCLYVVWGAGALFTLNPLGDFGRALPAVMTSTISGRYAVGGRLAAGVIVVVPIGVIVALLVGVASPLSAVETLALIVATTVGAIAAPALATGIGSLFPRFGSVNVTNNRKAVMPSKTAFVLYTLAIALPVAAVAVVWVDTAPELVAAIGSGILSLLPGVTVVVPSQTVTVVAWIFVAVGALAPPLSCWYAIRTFDDYTLE